MSIRWSLVIGPELGGCMMLKGLLVLDLSRVLSGPFATQQLVDMGARCLKIEHPRDGDDTRRFGPPFVGGESTYFMSVNRGKESVAIDLKAPRGQELVRTLAARADVVLENFRPGTAERLGIGVDALRALNPRLVTCSICGYGTGGVPELDTRGGYDAVIQAASGLMALTGDTNGPPTKVGIAIADMVAGMYAAQGILGALVERGLTQRGRHIEISMLDAMTSFLTYQAGIYFGTGKNPPRMGNAHPSICPYETFRVADGLYALAVGNDAQFARLAVLLGRSELARDPRFSTNRARVENRAALMDILAPKLFERTSQEWDARFAEEGIPGGPVLEVSEALEHPQLAARGSILAHDHPTAGLLRTIATPVRVDRVPPHPIAPPPLLGQHTRAVLDELCGISGAAFEDLAAAGVVRDGSADPGRA